MRLAAQEKLGYYAASPTAIAELVKHLRPVTPDQTNILDPCAGEGAAIQQLAIGLDVPEDRVYCVELDPGRGQTVKKLMPRAHVLSPCSFMGAAISWQTFGFVYCNSPFDDQLGGGGREEELFATTAYNLLATGGVFVMIAPYAVYNTPKIYKFLDSHYKEQRLYKFPDGARPFHECAFIGVKRNVVMSESRDGYMASNLDFASWRYSPDESVLAPLGDPDWKWKHGRHEGFEEELQVWTVPTCWKPSKFVKSAYTAEGLLEDLLKSPLNRLAEGVEEPPIKSPPLPLAGPHVGLLLASGALDGIVVTPNGNHVVRGRPHKIEYYNEDASSANPSDDGERMKVKDVYSQKPTVVIRAVDQTGTIYTFSAETKNS